VTTTTGPQLTDQELAALSDGAACATKLASVLNKLAVQLRSPKRGA
jgi:hypothetical protein